MGTKYKRLETHLTWRSARFQRDKLNLLWSVSCCSEPANSKHICAELPQQNEKCFWRKHSLSRRDRSASDWRAACQTLWSAAPEHHEGPCSLPSSSLCTHPTSSTSLYNSGLCHMQKYSDNTAIVGRIKDGREGEYRQWQEVKTMRGGATLKEESVNITFSTSTSTSSGSFSSSERHRAAVQMNFRLSLKRSLKLNPSDFSQQNNRISSEHWWVLSNLISQIVV